MHQASPSMARWNLLKKSMKMNFSKSFLLMIVMVFGNSKTEERKSEIASWVLSLMDKPPENEILRKMQELDEYPTEEQVYFMEQEEKVRFPR